MKTFIILYVSLVLSLPVFAEPGSVIFGSYTQAEYAQATSDQVEARLRVTSTTANVVVAGRSYIRVLSPEMDEVSARALIQRAKTEGFVGPWFLAKRKAVLEKENVRLPNAPAPLANDPSTKTANQTLALVNSSEQRLAAKATDEDTGSSLLLRSPSVNLTTPSLIKNPDKVVVDSATSPALHSIRPR